MVRKAITIVSLVGLVASLGLWGAWLIEGPLILYTDPALASLCKNKTWALGSIQKKAANPWTAGGPSWVVEKEGQIVEGTFHLLALGHSRLILTTVRAGKRQFSEDMWQTLDIGRSPGQNSVVVHLPYYVALFLALPLYHVLPFHRSRKRRKLGLCTKCGYDLRDLTKQRCPECGTWFVKKQLVPRTATDD